VLYKEYFRRYLGVFLILQFVSLFSFLSGNLIVGVVPFLKEAFSHQNVRQNVLNFIPFVYKLIKEGNIFMGTAGIFIINLTMGSFISITFPSFIIPFWGIFSGLLRFFLWGIIFSLHIRDFSFMKSHYLTLFLEGKGYIFAMFPVYVMWYEFFKSENKREVYFKGIKTAFLFYIFVIIFLLLGAFYEAFEGIYLLDLN